LLVYLSIAAVKLSKHGAPQERNELQSKYSSSKEKLEIRTRRR